MIGKGHRESDNLQSIVQKTIVLDADMLRGDDRSKCRIHEHSYSISLVILC